jgi:hypothetical protein
MADKCDMNYLARNESSLADFVWLAIKIYVF